MEVNFDNTAPEFNYSGDDFEKTPLTSIDEIKKLNLQEKRRLKIGEKITLAISLHISYNATHYFYDPSKQEVTFFGPFDTK